MSKAIKMKFGNDQIQNGTAAAKNFISIDLCATNISDVWGMYPMSAKLACKHFNILSIKLT